MFYFLLQALCLNKLQHTQVYQDGPRVWGMLEKVIHLIKIERIHNADAQFIVKRENPLRKKLGLSRWPNTPYH